MTEPAMFLLCLGLAIGWMGGLFPASGETICRVLAVLAFGVAAVFAAGVIA